jgi:hypothetical protein
MLRLCDALQLSSKDMELLDEIAKRKATRPLSTWSLQSEKWSLSKAPQTIASQMGPHLPVEAKACENKSERFTRFCSKDAKCFGLGTAGITVGDWVLHT